MKNYEAVEQWASTVNADKAYAELTTLMTKYPWLKCSETYELVSKMYTDLPKIINIIKHQEKQNAIHREFVRVSQMADAAIVTAVSQKFNLEI